MANNAAAKAKYRKQRQTDEAIVNKDYDAVTSGRRKSPSGRAVRADNELAQIGAKIYSANHPNFGFGPKQRNLARTERVKAKMTGPVPKSVERLAKKSGKIPRAKGEKGKKFPN